jgi:UDP-glucose 4-epimerase
MSFPFKNALVTGGAGFIGSHLCEEVVKLGVHTVSVDNYFAGKIENILHLKNTTNFEEYNVDVTDKAELKKHFKGVDIVFNLMASKKTICLKDPLRDLEINAAGTFNLLELARDFGVKKFVHASTGSVYGEAQYFPQDEKHPLNPNSYYGVSKLAGERYVHAFRQLYGMNTTILRYFHVYGARQESSEVGGVVSIFTSAMLKNKGITIFGDGTQERSFTYVKDVVRANLQSAIRPIAEGQVYNCASGIKVTINQLARMIANELGIKDLKVDYDQWLTGDIKIFNIDNQKIRNELEIDFLTNLEEGLKFTIDWAKDYFNAPKVL